MQIRCWFDGACNPNPWGAIGYGAHIITPFGEEEFYKGNLPSQNNSNNVAEYLGLRMILTYLRDNDFPTGTKVIIRGDSDLVVKQMTGLWKIKVGMYKEYALECKSLLGELESRYRIDIRWVPREKNERADELSKNGMSVYMKQTDDEFV